MLGCYRGFTCTSYRKVRLDHCLGLSLSLCDCMLLPVVGFVDIGSFLPSVCMLLHVVRFVDSDNFLPSICMLLHVVRFVDTDNFFAFRLYAVAIVVFLTFIKWCWLVGNGSAF